MKKRVGHRSVDSRRNPLRVIGSLLPQILAVTSILVGILGVFSSVFALFFFTGGAFILCGVMLVFFAGAVLLWFLGKAKKHRLRPAESVILQGRLFRLWFAGHNLSWAFVLNLITVILLFFFGPLFEVMAFGAGSLACTVFVLAGLFIGSGTRTLGVCWQSTVPRGVKHWGHYAGAALILRRRYERAVQQDQKRAEPVLWGVSRVLELAGAGGANRPIDLMDSPSTTGKTEFSHRVKVLVPIFLFTVLLVFFLRELPGVTPPHLHRFPDERTAGVFKGSGDADKGPEESRKKSGKQSKSRGINKGRSLTDLKKTDPLEKGGSVDKNETQSGNRGENAHRRARDEAGDRNDREPGTPGREDREGAARGESQDSRDPSRKDPGGERQNSGTEDSEREQGETGTEKKDKGKKEIDKKDGQCEGGSESGDQGQEGKGDRGQSSKDGQREGGTESGNQAQDGKEAQGECKGPGEGKGKGEGKGQGEGKGEGEGKGQGEGKGEGEGKGQGEGKGDGEGKGQGEGKGEGEGKGQGEGKGEGEGKGQGEGKGEGEGKGQGEGKGEGEGKGQGEGKGEGEGQGEGQGQGEGKSESESNGQGEGKGQGEGSQGSGAGEGQGEGKGGSGPGMGSGSSLEIPHPPPGAKGMLELDLPTVDLREAAKKPTAAEPDKREAGEAPVSPSIAVKKKRGKARPGGKAFKPEQYLPNWILALLSENDKKHN